MPTSAQENQFEAYARALVETGRYASAAAVLSAAMEALKREENAEHAKEAYVAQALEEGDASGAYEGDIFADLRTTYHLPDLK